MMIECPKCGFTQPKDKFCAKCGIDIDVFEPQKSQLYKKLLKSSVAQLLVLLGIVIVMATTYFPQNRDNVPLPQDAFVNISQKSQSSLKVQENLKSESRATTNSPYPPSPQTATATNVESLTDKETNPASKTETLPVTRSVETSSSSKTLSKNSKDGGAKTFSNFNKSSSKKTINALHVSFVEVPQMVLNDVVFSQKDGLLTEESYLRVGKYKFKSQLSKIVQKIPGLSFLPGTRSKKLPMSSEKPLTFQFVHMVDGEPHGLQLVVFAQVNPNQVVLGLEGEFNMKAISDSNMMSYSFQGSYNIQYNEILVIELSMPIQPMDETYRSTFAETPLSIMNRTDFLEGVTSLAILVQAR